MCDLTGLNHDLTAKAGEFIANCANIGIRVQIYCTARSPIEQAKLFRRSRKLFQIAKKRDQLKRRGYHVLAEILDRVGPQYGTIGRHVTKAAPGESWHQYGGAFDYVPIIAGKLAWDQDDFDLEWAACRNELKKIDLYSGFLWGDFPHAQIRTENNPLDVLPDNIISDVALAAVKEFS